LDDAPRISLLVPTRNRLKEFEAFAESAWETADYPEFIDIIAYIDEDDRSYDSLFHSDEFTFIQGPRIVLSQMWNECQLASSADIFGHMGDDIRFRTNHWDTLLRGAFPKDNIAFVHGYDGSIQDNTCFGTHGFIHRAWVDAVGYFVPPYFSCDFNDTWLNDVSHLINRHIRAEFTTEHLHPAWGKRPKDLSDRERENRGARDGVQALYDRHLPSRQNDAIKLLAAMYRARMIEVPS